MTNVREVSRYNMNCIHKQVTDGDVCKETVEVKRADIRLLQPPWADELEDAGSHAASSLHTQHLRIHHNHMPVQVRI